MSQQKILSDQQQYHFAFMIRAREAVIKEDKDNHTLTLKNIDTKALYMTARPGRDRAFISTDRFMNIWIENNNAFVLNVPQIAILHSGMKTDVNGLSQAISLVLSDPASEGGHGWKFKLKTQSKDLTAGHYQDVILVFDWLPAMECPEPIKLELPSLFK
jgi:hypothetical protein